MSYQIYHTEGFVLKHRPRGEDSKLLYLFTPDFGLILVVAQGVRKIGSKMRANISDYSYGHYSLVRGREFWRLVSAEKSSDFSAILSSARKREVIGHIFHLLLLLSGEEPSQEIFSELKEALGWFQGLNSKDKFILPAEKLLVLRLLSHLGYLKTDVLLADLAVGAWTEDKLIKLSQPDVGRYLTVYINKVLRGLN